MRQAPAGTGGAGDTGEKDMGPVLPHGVFLLLGGRGGVQTENKQQIYKQHTSRIW